MSEDGKRTAAATAVVADTERDCRAGGLGLEADIGADIHPMLHAACLS